MNADNEDRLHSLVRELRALPSETEWLEFKHNNDKPETIGRYISALSNSAALYGKDQAYMVWGIKDGTHDVIGTDFSPSTSKIGNEPIQTWLLQYLRPGINFRFHEITLDSFPVVLLEISPPPQYPVAFKRQEYIRRGSSLKNLRDYPEDERKLREILNQTKFEDGLAARDLSSDDILLRLDHASYFALLNRPQPDGKSAILTALKQDNLIRENEPNRYDITNVGAVLFAKDLNDFTLLRRKSVRVVQYSGPNKLDSLGELEETRGYASAFGQLIDYIDARSPAKEIIEGARRRQLPEFPKLAVRELVANALIHQDFLVSGTGPMIELFEGRIEITNPGKPLVDPNRFIDAPPVSRNDVLASLMRRFELCEERGSGIDKVIAEVERYQLPAPMFTVPPDSTRAVLFGWRSFAEMSKEERLRACYQHACLLHMNHQRVTNASLRHRFGLDDASASTVSVLLKDAVKEELIVVANPADGNRSRHYRPFWDPLETGF